MTSAAKLRSLAKMQALRENKVAGLVGKAAAEVRAKKDEVEDLARLRNNAQTLLQQTMASRTFCPDRMSLAVNRLAHTEHAFDRGQSELSQASALEADLRADWQEARFKSENVDGRANSAFREEARRLDDANIAASLSLRAAIQGSRKS